MAVNFFFQTGVPEEFGPNQRLIEDLIIQSIQITGYETYYISRSLGMVDPIFTEDSQSRFESAVPLEMYLENVNGFEGEGSLLSKFGIEINDSCTFVVARRRWQEEVGNSGVSILPERPTEGDLIYLPITKSYFEIRRVVADNPFYQLGKLYVYRLECELFRFGSEEFTTGIPEVDSIPELFSLAEETQLLLTEDNMVLVMENDAQLLQEYQYDREVAGAQNDAFEDTEGILDFSEHNPFGDLAR